MAKRILFLAFVVAISAFAHGAPSVWKQMETGQTTISRGIVKSVDLRGSEVWFKIETKDVFGDPTVGYVALCDLNSDKSPSSDEVRAALLKSKIDLLQESRRDRKPIEYGTRGIWDSCVSFLRTLES
jgi:hypothetical protein